MHDNSKKTVDVYLVHAFTSEPNGGNPAGVVLDTRLSLSDNQMKTISRRLQVSETAFATSFDAEAVSIRFFSPETEVDLCGHATIAFFYVYGQTLLRKERDTCIKVHQQTNAGRLPVYIIYQNRMITQVMMQQAPYTTKPCDISLAEVAEVLNIPISSIDTTLPFQCVSTGLFTLPICVQDFSVLSKVKPDFLTIKSLCTSYNIGSFHVFTFDTIEPSSLYHARNFAPLYGINEDPVTGTANGATCQYLFHHDKCPRTNLICEQGDIIKRPGRVHVDLSQGTVAGGSATIINKRTIPV